MLMVVNIMKYRNQNYNCFLFCFCFFAKFYFKMHAYGKYHAVHTSKFLNTTGSGGNFFPAPNKLTANDQFDQKLLAFRMFLTK